MHPMMEAMGKIKDRKLEIKRCLEVTSCPHCIGGVHGAGYPYRSPEWLFHCALEPRGKLFGIPCKKQDWERCRLNPLNAVTVNPKMIEIDDGDSMVGVIRKAER